MSEETTPHDIVAEQSALGSMLLSKNAITDVEEELSGSDFYRPAHETIYHAILEVHAAGDPVDALTVSDRLTRNGESKTTGGPVYIHELAQIVPSPTSAAYYAQIVARMAVRRRLITAGHEIAHMGNGPGSEDELVEAARKAVDQTTKATATNVQSFGETILDTLDTLDGAVNHIPTDWPTVNEIIGGLRPGALYVVGARPSVGKSAVALAIAQSLSRYGSVAFSSLEMSRDDIHLRAISADLRIDLTRLLNRNLTPGDWEKINGRQDVWAKVPLFIDDRSSVTATDIKRFARSVNRRRPLAGIVVDYLQLMTPPPGDKRPRHEFVADCSRQLKILAMEMNVPVILLSQLNRGSTQREDKMPQISDLRESGAVEQDADVVILLHREIMGENKYDLAMLIAKNRNGATNLAHLQFWGHYCQVRENGPMGVAA